MAKVVVTVDTEEGTLDVSVNGKTVENVDRVYCSCGYTYDSKGKEKERVYVDIHTKNEEEDGVMTMTHIMAALDNKYKETSLAQLLKG